MSHWLILFERTSHGIYTKNWSSVRYLNLLMWRLAIWRIKQNMGLLVDSEHMDTFHKPWVCRSTGITRIKHILNLNYAMIIVRLFSGESRIGKLRKTWVLAIIAVMHVRKSNNHPEMAFTWAIRTTPSMNRKHWTLTRSRPFANMSCLLISRHVSSRTCCFTWKSRTKGHFISICLFCLFIREWFAVEKH